MPSSDNNSNSNSVVDDIVAGVAEDEMFLEEEERIALEKIKEISEKLNDPQIPQDLAAQLQNELRDVYERFLKAAKITAQNSQRMQGEMQQLKNDEVKKEDEKLIEESLKALDNLTSKTG